MLTPHNTIAETRAQFHWEIPEFYNIGVDVSDRPAAIVPDAPAIIDVAEDGMERTYSFAELRDMSNQTARMLAKHVAQGDRVGVLLPQCLETALTHIAAMKLGAISLPLFTLFGPEALLHRLSDSGACCVVTNAKGAALIAEIRDELPALTHVYVTDNPAGGDLDFHAARMVEKPHFDAFKTRADDPALLIYTSGTTGLAKGALHAHRVLLGHLPGVEMSHDFLPQHGDKIWTPADWAWIGGLLDVLLPGLHHGVPVVACRFQKFTAEAAHQLIMDQGIRNAFLPPTALKMMRLAELAPLQLRSVASGGETLGAALIDWGREAFGVTINEFYGQTECNMIVSSCAALATAEPGVMGFPVPGHEVAVIDPTLGQRCAVGVVGEVAVLSPDPVMFLRYWNAPEATEQKFVDGPEGRWLRTGDTGATTPEGRIRFVGRDDDVISSGGYRIGPGEVEDCLLGHPAVQMAGVVGSPDALRGEIVVGFVTLVDGYVPNDTLAREIAEHVKTRLAAHEYPRHVHFLDQMPMTTTGKIIRHQLRALAAEQAG